MKIRIKNSIGVFIGLAMVFAICAANARGDCPETIELNKEGYDIAGIDVDCSGGLDFLPNGDMVGLGFNPSWQLELFRFDANNDGDPAGREALYTFPGFAWGSFVKVSPSGTFVIMGESMAGSIVKYDLISGVSTDLSAVMNNYDLEFTDDRNVYLSANPDYDPWDPASKPSSQVYHWDLDSNERVAVAEIEGPSGPIALDDAGNLYYVKSTYVFPAPDGSHELLRFKNEDLRNAIQSGSALDESSADVMATLDSVYNIVVNSFNDVFVSGNNGELNKVNLFDGTVENITKRLDDVSGFTALAMYKPNRFFAPFKQSESILAFFADNWKTGEEQAQVVCMLSPKESDPYADEVLEYSQGDLPFPTHAMYTDPQKAIGEPDNAFVTLGDRDIAGNRGHMTLKFNGGVSDDAENLHGLDLITFGNSMFAFGGQPPLARWAEPGIIEVSKDTNHDGIANDPWFLILPNVLPSELSGLDYGSSVLCGYADYTPTGGAFDYTYPNEPLVDGVYDSEIDPDSGGGDAVDLRDSVVQVTTGVPVPGNRHAFIDEIDFIRITDAIEGDEAGVVGIYTVEVDGVSDARNKILGETVQVDSVAALEAALSEAMPGDTIELMPGVYQLTGTLSIKSGVSVRGPAGLWTPNVKTDDAIIDGSDIYGPAFLLDAGTVSDQGYAVGGLHFSGCQTAILCNGTYPTIEENFFTDCSRGIFITALYPFDSESIVIRDNIFGHKTGDVLPHFGVHALSGSIACAHNTFINHDSAAVFISGMAKAYLRDNIFYKNIYGVWQEGAANVEGHYNCFFGNSALHVFSQGEMSDDILEDPSFASIGAGDYRLMPDSLIRGQGMGDADPGVYDGPMFYPFNIALNADADAPLAPEGLSAELVGAVCALAWDSNSEEDLAGYNIYRSISGGGVSFHKLNNTVVTDSTYVDDTIVTGLNYYYAVTAVDNSGNESGYSNIVEIDAGNYIIKLDIPGLINSGEDTRNGAYAMKMVLDYLGSVHGVEDLYDMAISNNLPGNTEYVDPRGAGYTLNNYDPPGYSFSPISHSDEDELLKSICFWISYRVPEVAVAYVPGIVPMHGNYADWMLVNGIVTSKDPWKSPSYDIVGFWLNDPAVGGIGYNVYVTADDFKNDYLEAMNTGDAYHGRFVSVLEPPEPKGATVRILGSKSRSGMAGMALCAQGPLAKGFDPYEEIKRNASLAVREEYLKYDKNLRGSFDKMKAQTPYLVMDKADGSEYYLVPFGLSSRVSLVVVLGKTENNLKQLSWSEMPCLYLPIKEYQVKGVINRILGGLSREDRDIAEIFLVKEKGDNYYYPSWQLSLGNAPINVDQGGKISFSSPEFAAASLYASSYCSRIRRPVRCRLYVKNISDIGAEPFSVKWSVYSVSQKRYVDVEVERYEGIGAGDRIVAGYTFTPVCAGNYRIEAEIDPENAIIEFSESNNSISRNVTVRGYRYYFWDRFRRFLLRFRFWRR